MSYNISNLRNVSKIAAHFQNNNKMFISFIQVSKQRKWKNIKKLGCRASYRTLSNIFDGTFSAKIQRLKAAKYICEKASL